MHTILIYGSYGYSGSLIVEEALRRGLEPLLAGRNAERLARQAHALGLDYCVFDLADLRLVRENLRGATAVLNCAGPFAATAGPLVEACLEARVHYLDITGELDVFEMLSARHQEALERGVMLLPGVGFDVVPSDCLAVHLAQQLPGAVRLELAVASQGGVSRGTARTALAMMRKGAAVRRDGKLVPVPLAFEARRVDFGFGPRLAVTAPLGDLIAAYHSTGVANIETFLALPRRFERLAAVTPLRRAVGRLLERGWAQRALVAMARLDRLPEGPDAEARARGSGWVWGAVHDAEGNRREARLRTPEAYTLTAASAVAALLRVVAGCAPPGFQTPARAFSPELAFALEGVELLD